MITTFRLNTNELNDAFVESIKKLFFNKEIEILVRTTDNNVDFKYSDNLINAVNNIEKNKNIKSFTIEEFEEFSSSLLK
ncbi:MAG: hypothetical protein B6I20_12325 [Bacteroidetes bacterium 4572_117]|nr:MAG: hypothetical protein B6I20_12325 [Bacteroidetes bacterium 4572_117]